MTSIPEVNAAQHEAAFISAFILAERRGRWQEFLSDKRRRGKQLHRLADSRDFDFGRIKPISKTGSSDEEIVRQLVALGSPPSVYVISESRSLDGQTMPLDDAIAACTGMGLGTLVSCVAGRLCFFQEEPAFKKWILASQGAIEKPGKYR